MEQETGKALAQTTRRSIEAAFRSDTEEPAIAVAGILGERHGVFVTIRGPRRKLRGCVGTLKPYFANTAEETWHVARDAAFRDGRFAPVRAHELEQLRCEVSVIMPLEDVASPAELDPRHYGVVVAAADGRRGVHHRAAFRAIPGAVADVDALAAGRGKIERLPPMGVDPACVQRVFAALLVPLADSYFGRLRVAAIRPQETRRRHAIRQQVQCLAQSVAERAVDFVRRAPANARSQPRARASLVSAKSSRTKVQAPVYVAGFDRGVRPIGDWSIVITLFFKFPLKYLNYHLQYLTVLKILFPLH